MRNGRNPVLSLEWSGERAVVVLVAHDGERAESRD